MNAIKKLAGFVDALPKPVTVILHLPADKPVAKVIIERQAAAGRSRCYATFSLDLSALEDSKWADEQERALFAKAVRLLAHEAGLATNPSVGQHDAQQNK